MDTKSSYVVSKVRCPKCAEMGGDRSGDNLVMYSDGGGHCFNCGYHIGGSIIKRYQTKQKKSTHKEVHLPYDITNELPAHALKWLQQYGFTQNDRVTHKVLWSDNYSRIIFPFFGDNGLLAWQGRYLGNGENAKWFSQGYIHDIIVPINISTDTAILVESFISAFVVGKVHGAIPLFGSQTNGKHLLRLKHVVDNVLVWLDPDKRSEAVKISSMANLLGLNSKVIFTDKKPHQMSQEEIQYVIQTI